MWRNFGTNVYRAPDGEGGGEGGEPTGADTNGNPAGDAAGNPDNGGAPDSGQQPSAGQQSGEDNPPAFAVPEAYKEKPWVSKIKSEDDLWKQVENLQNLAGRKHAPIDFEKATPQEIEDYFKETRPEDKGEYTFKTSDDYAETGLEDGFAQMLYDAGITKHQGDMLIKQYQAMEGKMKEQMYDTDDFMDMMEKSFGKNYGITVDRTRQIIESNLNDAQKAALDDIPNNYLAFIYQLVHNLDKSYGVHESGKQGDSQPGFNTKESVEETRRRLRGEIASISKRPHTAEEKQALINQLDSTYKQKK